jgi:surface polysaccharide O-acyltransferase-like enzyme
MPTQTRRQAFMPPEKALAGPVATLPGAVSLEKDSPPKSKQSGQPYLYELDRLRIVTALSVVAVHVTALMAFLETTQPGLQAQNAFVTLFHFTRAVFMFVTAFALVYVYERKPFTWGAFWKRRGLGVLLPYVFWSLIYILVNPYPSAPLDFTGLLFKDLLTGAASFQLYYILLTIQFYIVFPWFLKGLRCVASHPWIVLGCSFALEVGTLYAIQNNLVAYLPDGIASTIDQYQNSFVLVYQFYFILGGLVALNLSRVRVFLLQHGTWVVVCVGAALVALELHYVGALQLAHMSLDSAVAVLQPIMAFYSTAVIFFLYWLAYRQVSRLAHPASARGQRIWHSLSDASFGVYLVHPLFLNALITLVAAHFMAWPPLVVVPLVWLLTAGGSVASTVLLLRVPLFSRLVGRARPLPDRVVLAARWKKVTSFFDRYAGLRTRAVRAREEDQPASRSLASEAAIEPLQVGMVENGTAIAGKKRSVWRGR